MEKDPFEMLKEVFRGSPEPHPKCGHKPLEDIKPRLAKVYDFAEAKKKREERFKK